MFHLESILVIVLTFFGFTSAPVSTVEVPVATSTIQAYEEYIEPIVQEEVRTTTVTASVGVHPEPRITQIIIPIINQPMPPEPIAQPFEVPLPAESVPEAPAQEVPVPTTLSVTNISKRPLYSDCSANPIASFLVTVSDQYGENMNDVVVSYTGSAENNPGGTFTALSSGSTFHYTIKGIEEGTVNLTFFVENADRIELVKHFELQVLKAPTEPSERPAWCD